MYNNYLYNIYIALVIISNIEMILTMQQDIHWLYAKSAPFYIRDLSIYGFWYPKEVLGQVLHRYWRTAVFPFAL